MAAITRLSVLCLWIICLICVSHCWDLMPLNPVSCPDNSEENGVCYRMESKQVRCVNVTIGPCSDMMEQAKNSPGTSNVRRYLGWHGMCLDIASGLCTMYTCQRRCCEDYYTEDYRDCDRDTQNCDKQCENGGICVEDIRGDINYGMKCQCRKPFYGETCEKVKCREECQNGGSCIIDGSGSMCACADGYFGKTCSNLESDIPYSCPKPNKTECSDWQGCTDTCWLNNECPKRQICCNDGCCSRCVKPTFCHYGGKLYRPGDVFSNTCGECRCLATGNVECSEITCPSLTCRNGAEPVAKYGKCCKVCPDDDSQTGPTFENCKSGELKRLPVRIYTKVGFLEDLSIKAFDHKRNSLDVTYPREYIEHCKCSYVNRNTHVVMALARDSQGRVSTCEFRILVTDPFRPVYNSCPANIHALEEEVITWQYPRAYDYVGIMSQSCDQRNGQSMSKGIHLVTCTAEDYDGNKAYCRFTVVVYMSDTDESRMPPGLKDRQRVGMSLPGILVATFSTILAVLILVSVGCFIKRRRNTRQRQQQQRQQQQQPHRQNNTRSLHIHAISNLDYYGVCDRPDGVKLPPYSPAPEPPPDYEDIRRNGEDLQPPPYVESTAHTHAHGGSGSGYLNSAYDLADPVNETQGRPTPCEEDIYEEININLHR